MSKEKVSKYNREYYIKNRDKILERHKKYKEENPEKVKKTLEKTE